jgi:hypothetical protein
MSGITRHTRPCYMADDVWSSTFQPDQTVSWCRAITVFYIHTTPATLDSFLRSKNNDRHPNQCQRHYHACRVRKDKRLEDWYCHRRCGADMPLVRSLDATRMVQAPTPIYHAHFSGDQILAARQILFRIICSDSATHARDHVHGLGLRLVHSSRTSSFL